MTSGALQGATRALHAVVTVTSSPPPITREGAARAARDEVSKAIYQRSKPPWWLSPLQRVLRWASEQLGHVANAVGGFPALWALLVLVALVAAFVFWRVGPPARRAKAGRLTPDRPTTASDHRRIAQEHARAGRWAEAVREQLRAVLREMEVRTLIDRKPGRTAGELARDGASALPALADDLYAGAAIFNEIWYGRRTATEADHARLVALDTAVQRAHPRLDASASLDTSMAL